MKFKFEIHVKLPVAVKILCNVIADRNKRVFIKGYHYVFNIWLEHLVVRYTSFNMFRFEATYTLLL